MPRKKKEAPNHGKYFVVKAVVGHRIDGRPIYKSFYSKISKEDARMKAQTYITEKAVAEETGAAFIEKSVTFGKWAERWLEVYKKPTVDETTYTHTYRYVVERFLLPSFGPAPLTSIRQIDVTAFFAEHAYLSQSVLDKCLLTLRGIFDAAIENDLCYKNPCGRIKAVSAKKPAVKQVYTARQMETLEEYCFQTRQMMEVVILLETGLRRGELLGLKWEDVDRRQKTVSVNRSVASVAGGIKINPPKWGSYRVIPLSNRALDAFFRIPNEGTAYIFPGRDEDMPLRPDSWATKLRRFMRRVNADLGLPELSAHELRHTFGTNLRRNGVDLYTIQKVMGHKDIDVTANTYVHNEIEVLADRMSPVIRKNS